MTGSLQIAASIVPGGAQIFHRLYTRLGCQGRPPHFVVMFYPYADLTHTIRLRQDTAFVRLSDLLRDAPIAVLEAAAGILLARIYRRKAPKELIDRHKNFCYSRATRQRLLEIRRRRARRVKGTARGKCHDLTPLFRQLNQRYFRDGLVIPRLGWSSRSWRSQLGCFDPALNQIVLNRDLDRPGVPEFVVAYVLYHEMLHLKHPLRFARCRLESHSPKFRMEEKRFVDYKRAV
ncbi:MAG: hypothetical protein ACRD4K_11955, partial [Candidatus Acidiferrales bacterium]